MSARRAPVDPEQARAEWLEWRRQGIGATDVAGIVGLSPWASPYAVWADKTGRLPLDDGEPTVEQEFGLRAEAMLAPWFQDLTGYLARRWQHRAVHRDWRKARATLDALVYRTRRSAAPLGPLELKTTDRQRDWTLDDGGTFPAHYAVQVQWQLEVTDLDRAWLFALHGRRPVIYLIARNVDDGRWLLDVARRFWRDHVEADVPPPADGHRATTEALQRVERIAGDVVELDLDEYPLVAEVLDARAAARAAEARLTEASNRLKARLGDGEIATVAGHVVATYATRHRRGYTVDPTTFRALVVKAPPS